MLPEIALWGATPSPGRSEPSLGPFPDQITLELGKGGKDVEDELTLGSGCVDRVGQTLQSNLLFVKPVNDFEKVSQRAAQPVEFPDQDDIAGPNLFQHLAELRPIRPGAAGLFDKEAIETRLLQGIKWEVRVLIRGSDSRVTEDHFEIRGPDPGESGRKAKQKARREGRVWRTLSEFVGPPGQKVMSWPLVSRRQSPELQTSSNRLGAVHGTDLARRDGGRNLPRPALIAKVRSEPVQIEGLKARVLQGLHIFPGSPARRVACSLRWRARWRALARAM